MWSASAAEITGGSGVQPAQIDFSPLCSLVLAKGDSEKQSFDMRCNTNPVGNWLMLRVISSWGSGFQQSQSAVLRQVGVEGRLLSADQAAQNFGSFVPNMLLSSGSLTFLESCLIPEVKVDLTFNNHSHADALLHTKSMEDRLAMRSQRPLVVNVVMRKMYTDLGVFTLDEVVCRDYFGASSHIMAAMANKYYEALLNNKQQLVKQFLNGWLKGGVRVLNFRKLAGREEGSKGYRVGDGMRTVGTIADKGLGKLGNVVSHVPIVGGLGAGLLGAVGSVTKGVFHAGGSVVGTTASAVGKGAKTVAGGQASETWRENSGRATGKKGYVFGDVTRSFFKGFK